MMSHKSANIETTVGVLGTVGSWHLWAPRYGLNHLERLVRAFAPDLLCAAINPAGWEGRHLAHLSVEYRECLVGLCREMGIIIVPVGDGWCGRISPLRLALLLGAGAAAMNSAFADRFHRAWARFSHDSPREDQELVERVLQAVRRDPGRRVLVTVRLERRHAVVDQLSQAPDVVPGSVWE
jgi:hypothetical protein